MYIISGDRISLSESKGNEEGDEKLRAAPGSSSSCGDVSVELAAAVGGGSRSFSSLKEVVSDKTLKAVEEMGFTDMMEIQYRAIRPLLEGR